MARRRKPCDFCEDDNYGDYIEHDAFDVEAENVGEIKYSDRFPKPEWCE